MSPGHVLVKANGFWEGLDSVHLLTSKAAENNSTRQHAVHPVAIGPAQYHYCCSLVETINKRRGCARFTKSCCADGNAPARICCSTPNTVRACCSPRGCIQQRHLGEATRECWQYALTSCWPGVTALVTHRMPICMQQTSLPKQRDSSPALEPSQAAEPSTCPQHGSK